MVWGGRPASPIGEGWGGILGGGRSCPKCGLLCKRPHSRPAIHVTFRAAPLDVSKQMAAIGRHPALSRCVKILAKVGFQLSAETVPRCPLFQVHPETGNQDKAVNSSLHRGSGVRSLSITLGTTYFIRQPKFLGHSKPVLRTLLECAMWTTGPMSSPRYSFEPGLRRQRHSSNPDRRPDLCRQVSCAACSVSRRAAPLPARRSMQPWDSTADNRERSRRNPEAPGVGSSPYNACFFYFQSLR